ncbi:hypothetical protein Enr13x_16380 [Stieleria neptunia]|uniref:Uncharacterized protein n=1 Tax=Stieleria neptunia TaxID=2527979 RepID=A0A518HLS2_9BACT|nr:hypothetical protein [Stieleria neptunia]QDV41795.1 hypothetical protein Enr13x_16380 [Stieleria neptunia]
MTQPETNNNRRQWLIRTGRYTLLGGLSVLSLNLLDRALRSGCVRLESPCQSCELFKACELSKAAETRQATTEGQTS